MVHQKQDRATGLIQFMPKTAEGLGTSTEELSKMSRSEQLEYVDKHFETNLKGRLGDEGGDISDLYMSVLFPAAVWVNQMTLFSLVRVQSRDMLKVVRHMNRI